jgi:hypothetical protein
MTSDFADFADKNLGNLCTLRFSFNTGCHPLCLLRRDWKSRLLFISNSQSKMMCASTHRLKPMADTQNLLKQVGERLPERVLTRFL